MLGRGGVFWGRDFCTMRAPTTIELGFSAQRDALKSANGASVGRGPDHDALPPRPLAAAALPPSIAASLAALEGLWISGRPRKRSGSAAGPEPGPNTNGPRR